MAVEEDDDDVIFFSLIALLTSCLYCNKASAIIRTTPQPPLKIIEKANKKIIITIHKSP